MHRGGEGGLLISYFCFVRLDDCISDTLVRVLFVGTGGVDFYPGEAEKVRKMLRMLDPPRRTRICVGGAWMRWVFSPRTHVPF